LGKRSTPVGTAAGNTPAGKTPAGKTPAGKTHPAKKQAAQTSESRAAGSGAPKPEPASRRTAVTEWLAIGAAAVALVPALVAGRPTSTTEVAAALLLAGPAWLVRTRVRGISAPRRDRMIRTGSLALAVAAAVTLAVPAARAVLLHDVLGYPQRSFDIEQLAPASTGSGPGMYEALNGVLAVFHNGMAESRLVTSITVTFNTYGNDCYTTGNFVTYTFRVPAGARVDGHQPVVGTVAQQAAMADEADLPLNLPATLRLAGNDCEEGMQVTVTMTASLRLPAGADCDVLVKVASDDREFVIGRIRPGSIRMTLRLEDGSRVTSNAAER